VVVVNNPDWVVAWSQLPPGNVVSGARPLMVTPLPPPVKVSLTINVADAVESDALQTIDAVTIATNLCVRWKVFRLRSTMLLPCK
jgi:hypothetical protein